MNTNIIVTLSVEGLHYFPNAGSIFPEVGFLENAHRHTFTFRVEKKVKHDKRDIEFILFKRAIINYLVTLYGNSEEGNILYFGSKSCEELAREIFNAYDCELVEVWEDNENGSKIYK